MREAYAEGIAWGAAKQQVFELINDELADARKRYEALMAAPDEVEALLLEGAAKARSFATPYLGELRAAVGIRPLAS